MINGHISIDIDAKRIYVHNVCMSPNPIYSKVVQNLQIKRINETSCRIITYFETKLRRRDGHKDHKGYSFGSSYVCECVGNEYRFFYKDRLIWSIDEYKRGITIHQYDAILEKVPRELIITAIKQYFNPFDGAIELEFSDTQPSKPKRGRPRLYTDEERKLRHRQQALRSYHKRKNERKELIN